MSKPGSASVVLLPGSFTRASAFCGVAQQMNRNGYPTVTVDLPARSARVAQLHRGGLRAIDRAVSRAVDCAVDSAIGDLIAAGHVVDAWTDGHGRAGQRSGQRPLVLVGHSLGGLAAYRAAAREATRASALPGRPRLAAVVLLMPVPPTGLLATLARSVLHDPVSTAKLVGLAVSPRPVRLLPVTPPRGLYTPGATRDILDAGRRRRVGESWLVLAQLALGTRRTVTRLGIPTLVVGGRHDGLTPPAVVQRFARHLSADYVTLPVAHAFNEEPTSDVVTDYVTSWLNRTVQAAAVTATAAAAPRCQPAERNRS